MQINRLFEIVYILLEKKMVTANELAEHFEVSVRTIYRDVNVLSSAGVPIYASRGKGGGVGLLEDYILNKSILSDNEQNEILFALQSLTVTQNLQVDTVLSKLSTIFNKNVTNWIEVDLSPWGSDKNQVSKFATLKNSIFECLTIEFEYINGLGERSSRKVEPMKLVYKVNAWYLYGFCLSRNSYRMFKVSRMSDIHQTKEHFLKRIECDEAIENKTGEWISVKLKFSVDGVYRAYEEFGEEGINKNKDGSLLVDTFLPDNKWLIGYLLSFGESVEVIAPKQICDEIYRQSEKIFKKYQNKNL